MAELTKRERLLIVLMSTIVNPMWNNEPWDQQYKVFRMLQAVHSLGKFSDDEINDLVQAIRSVYNEIEGQAKYNLKHI